MSGKYQLLNAGLAIALATEWLRVERPSLHKEVARSLDARLLPETYMEGLSKARLGGRCQRATVAEYPNVIWFLDGAHTKESLQVHCPEESLPASQLSGYP